MALICLIIASDCARCILSHTPGYYAKVIRPKNLDECWRWPSAAQDVLEADEKLNDQCPRNTQEMAAAYQYRGFGPRSKLRRAEFPDANVSAEWQQHSQWMGASVGSNEEEPIGDFTPML